MRPGSPTTSTVWVSTFSQVPWTNGERPADYRLLGSTPVAGEGVAESDEVRAVRPEQHGQSLVTTELGGGAGQARPALTD